ncbi:MAG: hypothetical protein KA154_13175 [Gemmatimonadaceae bacterium]|jgi:hypothetical protein|nr:hypothetical protein [Gemmatimonadaceae bacterium]MCC6431716.1 hypothetical protein [Gemmatimonadaceae bacterium]
MAIWDKVKQGIDKAGKAAQDVFDEGKLRIDAYRAREQADKAAEALGYAVFRAWENGAELDADARERLASALRSREDEARKLEKALADERAAAGEPPAASPNMNANDAPISDTPPPAAPSDPSPQS